MRHRVAVVRRRGPEPAGPLVVQGRRDLLQPATTGRDRAEVRAARRELPCPGQLAQVAQRRAAGLERALWLFSLYDWLGVSDEQIQTGADEAEAGYDVEERKEQGRGRP